MITIRRGTSIQLEKYLRPALPDPNSYEGNEFILNFQYQSKSKVKSIVNDTVFTARFVKQRYYEKNLSKEMWKWVYQGITE